jgi:hypothetical protein
LAGLKPVAFRLASLPASAEPGQKLVLCAANIGTGSVDVTLEFINVKTGGVVIDKTVSLEPLGAGTASQPCVTTEVAAAAGAQTAGPMASSFAASGAANGAAAASPTDGEALLVGVAMVRKSLLSFREAQVTASIRRRHAHRPDHPAQPRRPSIRWRAGECAGFFRRASQVSSACGRPARPWQWSD